MSAGCVGWNQELQSFFTAMEHSARATRLLDQLPGSFAPPTSARWRPFSTACRGLCYAVEVRTLRSSTRTLGPATRTVLGRIGAEWVPFDTVTLFGTPATSYAERESLDEEAPRTPPVARAHRSPIVRYIGATIPS